MAIERLACIALTAGLALACSSHEPGAPAGCAAVAPLVILSNADMPQSLAAAADASGYALFWGAFATESTPHAGGIFGARPGRAAVHIYEASGAPNVAAHGLAGGGFLLCSASGCFATDADLKAVGPPMPISGDLVQLVALSSGGFLVYSADGEAGTVTPIDAHGAIAGTAWTSPCKLVFVGEVAGAGDRLACLDLSSGECLGEYHPNDGGGPPVCSYSLKIVDATGALIAELPALIPSGQGAGLVSPTVAARSDGFLVAWQDFAGVHVLPVSVDGVAGQPLILPDMTGHVLAAVLSGYVLLGEKAVDETYTMPTLTVFGPDGQPLVASRFLDKPPADDPLQVEDGAAVASFGGRFGVLWRGYGGPQGNSTSWLHFRDVGCDGSDLTATSP